MSDKKTADDRPEAIDLATLLQEWRKKAGLTQMQVAERTRRNQPWISRFERRDAAPSPLDIETLAELYHVPTDVKQRMLALSRDLHGDPVMPARLVMTREAGEMQARIGRIEASSQRIATFATTVVPGLLQTEPYMRLVFASGNDLPPDQQSNALRERLARTRLLREPGREFVFVLTEGVLRWALGGPKVMADQLDHIIDLSRVPGVRVGVIPSTTSVDVAPMHAFDLHDRRAAIVGIETATAFLTTRHDVAAYVKLWADLEALASFGEDARAVLAACADRYRTA